MPNILPHESTVRKSIRQNLADELACANSFLHFGVALPTTKDVNTVNLPGDTIVSVIGLFVKASTSFRAIIHLCESGLERSAQPLSRSLFENFVYLSLLIRRRVTLYRFNGPNRTALPLHGAKLTPEFRTALFNAWSILRDEHSINQWATTPGLIQEGKRVRRRLQTMVRPYVATIGPAWEGQIKRSNTCVGLSIKDLAASLGPEYRKWHGVVYATDSKNVHQSDLINYLDFDDSTESFVPRWHTSLDEVRTVLQQATTIYLGCVEELNKRFAFGDEAKKRIKECADDLKQWK